MIKNLNNLADRLKGVQVNGKDLTAEELKTFISSEEEIEISVPKVNVLTDTELETVKTTVASGGKDSGFVEGMKSGTEQLVKAIRNVKGLEFEGKIKYDATGKIDYNLTASHIAEHYDAKVLSDAKIEPEKRIKELEVSLQKVQKTYDEEKTGWENKSKEFDGKIKSLNQDFFLQTNLPQVEGLNKKQLAVLIKTDGYSVEFDENGIAYPVQFGKKLVDKMEKPVPFDTFALNYVEQNGWGTKPVGKAGGDQNPDSPGKFKTKMKCLPIWKKIKLTLNPQKDKIL